MRCGGRPSRSFWDLKLAPGGFVDIEFAAQALQLTWAARAPEVVSANTGEALARLAAAGALTPDAKARLSGAWRLYSALQQELLISLAGEFNLATAPAPRTARLAAIAGTKNGDELEAKLQATQAEVRAAFVQIVGAAGEGAPAE